MHGQNISLIQSLLNPEENTIKGEDQQGNARTEMSK